MRTLIKNITLVDATGSRNGQVMIENGKIRKVYKPTGRVQTHFERVIDGGGKTLMPGLIDMHSHLRDPGLTHKEDLTSGLSAAARGGFTTVCAMANTKPVMDNIEMVKSNLDKAKAIGKTELLQVAAVTKDFSDADFVDFESLRDNVPYFSNDGHNIDNAETMRKALKISAETGILIATHNEPEARTIRRDIDMMKAIPGARLHLCHISTEETLNLVRQGKDAGLDLTCEVTPHHLYGSGLDYRVHPPFRSLRDKNALIEGAKDGSIDICGTDHAPHSAADKQAGAPGLINFETAFGMYYTVFARAGISLARLSAMMSEAPAKRLGLKAGLIKEGYPADMILVDPEREWRIDVKKFVSKSRNTPFDGDLLTGSVIWTMKGGNIIYDRGSFV